MSNVWFCSDWHLGHKNMAMKFRSYMGFSSIEEHDQFFIDEWNKHVTKRDVVYCLGDMAVNREGNMKIGELVAQEKRLVMGNHDFDNDLELIDLLTTYDEVYGFIRYKNYWLSHCPIHETELQYGKRGNIHGHIHGSPPVSPKHFNCSPEFLMAVYGRPLVKFEEIKEHFEHV